MEPLPSPTPAQEETLRLLHQRWRVVIFIPVLYLLIGLAVSHWYFVPHRDGRGLYPLQEETSGILFILGGLVVSLLFLRALFKRRANLLELKAVEEDPRAWREKALEQQMTFFLYSDLSTGPGLILFILNGDPVPLVAFIMVSLAFYLWSMPSPASLGVAR